jgi:hypothetical protein
MNYDDLVKKINDIMINLKSWQDFALKTKEKDEDLTKLEEELSNREKIVEKETVIARERKLVLDAREKNIESQEARLQRLSQT